MEPQETPLFDSSRAALAFALNADKVEMPRPFMNKAMAEAPQPKRRKRKKKVVVEVLTLAEVFGAAPLADEPPEPPEPKMRPYISPGQRLRGLAAAAQAGLILQQLALLDSDHQVLLTGRMARQRDNCECRSLCCRGWRYNRRWTEAVAATCMMVKDKLTYTEWPHRQGLGTQPALRKALVEQYYAGRQATVAQLVAECELSAMTVTRHRDYIFSYLSRIEGEAWLEADAMFDRWGITGAQP